MKLHSQIMGDGSPFVILHGFLGMGDNWKTLGNRFADEGFQVHLVDQRNHGRSFHDEQFNYEVMAEDLLGYLEAEGIDQIMLLGHSMGGKTAMEFATRYPEKVVALMVADIAPKAYPQHHQDILKGLSSLDFSNLDSRGAADEALSKYVTHFGTRQFLLKNLYWVSKGQLGLRINLPVLIENIEEVGKPIPEDALYEGPTLFVKGAKSGYIQALDELLISKHFPKAEIATIPKAGHWLHADNPDDFFDEILGFLSRFTEL